VDILELVTSALTSLNIKCIYGWYDESLNSTHITFLEFDNEDSDYSDDEAITEEHWIQVDIWTKDTEEAQILKKQVKELLKSNSFNYQNGADQFEIDTKLWHIAQRFLYIEDLD